MASNNTTVNATQIRFSASMMKIEAVGVTIQFGTITEDILATVMPQPATQIGGGRTSTDEATPVPNSRVISRLPLRRRRPNVIIPNPPRTLAKERLVVPSAATRMVMEGQLKFSNAQLARTSVFKRLAPINPEAFNSGPPRKSVFDRLTTSTGEVAEIALHPKSKSFKRNVRRSLKRQQVRENNGTKEPPSVKVVVEPVSLMHNKFASLKFVKKNSPTAVLRPNTEMDHLQPVNETGHLQSASEASPRHKETTIFQCIYEALKEVKRHRMGENIFAIRGQKQPLQVNKKITKQWRPGKEYC